MKSVLLFKPGSIGDCLMGKYFLENVRAAYPGAHCTIAAGARVEMVRDLLAAYPWIKVVGTRSIPPQRYDLAVLPYTGGAVPLRVKLLARLLARRLIGFSDRSPFTFLYNIVLPLEGRARAPRLLECDALHGAGIPVSIERPTFVYLPQPQLFRQLGLQEKNYIVLHLFSGGNA